MTRTRTYSWSDPTEIVAAALEVSGAELMEGFADGTIPAPPLVSTLGGGPFRLVEPGVVAAAFTPEEFHYNPMGSVHGGVFSAVCDTLCGCAVQSTLPRGAFYTSLDLSITFVRAATVATGVLHGTGRVLNAGRRIALAEASLIDTSGRLFAHATSRCLVTRPAPS